MKTSSVAKACKMQPLDTERQSTSEREIKRDRQGHRESAVCCHLHSSYSRATAAAAAAAVAKLTMRVALTLLFAESVKCILSFL